MSHKELSEVDKIKLEKLKLRKIKAEIKRLNLLFSELDESTKKAVVSTIENAAFMSVTLDLLQKDINQKGCISTYKNGENQFGTKKSPEVEIYNTMIKNHMGIIKQLTDLLPKKVEKEKDDGFYDFVIGRDDE